MYKKISEEMTISTTRKKTESKYVSNFINFCENLEPLSLTESLDELMKNKKIDKFNIEIKRLGKWVGGSISSIQLNIYNNAYKLPIVRFIENYKPDDMTNEDCQIYIEYLRHKVEPKFTPDGYSTVA